MNLLREIDAKRNLIATSFSKEKPLLALNPVASIPRDRVSLSSRHEVLSCALVVRYKFTYVHGFATV